MKLLLLIGTVGGAGLISPALGRHLSESFVAKVLDKKPIPRDFKVKLEYEQCDIQEYDARAHLPPREE